MNAFLLVEIFDYRRVFSREGLESVFASGIRKTAGVEDEAAAMSALIFWPASMK